MSCTVARRDRVRAAARDLDEFPVVVGAAIQPPDTGPTRRWTLDAILDGSDIPARVLAVLAEHDLHLRPEATGTRVAPASVRLVATV